MVPLILLLLVAAGSLYFFLVVKKKRQPVLTAAPIDAAILKEHVLFYSNLDETKQAQFENDIQFFLAHTPVTGVDTDVEMLDKMLIASAAVIPLFYFEKWHYPNLKEVLLYSDAINMNFETKGDNIGRNILGMVGTGVYEGKMLISKHALRQGFSNKTDKRNTAIHEFVHLVDKWDGDTDGVPAALLGKEYVLPWLDLIKKKMREIAAGKSDIDPYAYTSNAEFFAVVSEYFFERPSLLEEKHPKLFKMLVDMFETPEADNAS